MQGASAVAVKVKITAPAAMSSVLGVETGLIEFQANH